MNQREIKNIRIFLAFLLIIFIIILGTLVMKIIKENAECQQDPFTYGAKNIQERGFEINCNCYFLGDDYDPFYFDSEGIKEFKI